MNSTGDYLEDCLLQLQLLLQAIRENEFIRIRPIVFLESLLKILIPFRFNVLFYVCRLYYSSGQCTLQFSAETINYFMEVIGIEFLYSTHTVHIGVTVFIT